MCRCVSPRGGETESMAVKEISYREKLDPCPAHLDPAPSLTHTHMYTGDELIKR